MPATMKGSPSPKKGPLPSPTKLIASPNSPTNRADKTPARRTPFHLDDPQYDSERLLNPGLGFVELHQRTLSVAQQEQQAEKERKMAAEKKFKERQLARIAMEDEVKQREKEMRLLHLKEMRWDTEGYYTKEPGASGPQRWLWGMANKHPRQWAGQSAGPHDVAVGHQPLHSDGGVIMAYADSIDEFEADIVANAVDRRIAADDAILNVEERRKQERETAAQTMRDEMREKREAAAKAELARCRRIKKEMAEETKQQNALLEKQAAERYKASVAQRQANEAYAKSHGHWDWSPVKALTE
jgi:hypothetical protein